MARGYVPDGMTADQYKKFKEKEAAAKPKNLGRVGPRGFKSRSMQSFIEARERGEAEHLMPVFNAKEKVASGELRPEDIPYMQRGGRWDNADIKGAKVTKWLKSDKEYDNGGYKKTQSVSIFGGESLPWKDGKVAIDKVEVKNPTIVNPPKIKFDPRGKIVAPEKKPWW